MDGEASYGCLKSSPPGHATEYDAVNQLCAASGQLMVRDTFWAGSMQHFSMRCGKVSAAHLGINYEGTLLPEGHLAEHCVQADPPL